MAQPFTTFNHSATGELLCHPCLSSANQVEEFLNVIQGSQGERLFNKITGLSLEDQSWDPWVDCTEDEGRAWDQMGEVLRRLLERDGGDQRFKHLVVSSSVLPVLDMPMPTGAIATTTGPSKKYSIDTLVLSGHDIETSLFSSRFRIKRLVYYACSDALRSVGMNDVIYQAAGMGTRQVDLLVGNFLDNPSTLFRELGGVFHSLSELWRGNSTGEIRLFLRDTTPEWQYEGVETIAKRLADEHGSSFPRLQVAMWRAHGSSQIEAEQHAWATHSWLDPSVDRLSSSANAADKESGSSRDWCHCTQDVTAWDSEDEHYAPGESERLWLKKLNDVCDEYEESWAALGASSSDQV